MNGVESALLSPAQITEAVKADLRGRMPESAKLAHDQAKAVLAARMTEGFPPQASAAPRATVRESIAAPSAARTPGARPPAAVPSAPAGKWGFLNVTEYLVAVMQSSKGGGRRVDPRLIANAPTTGSIGQEASGAEGGFAVPPDFRTAIVEKIFGVASLLALTDRQITESNTITLPVDETTPWQATGGIQTYWGNEAEQIAQSKLSIAAKTMKLNKLVALVPVTDELLEDTAALGSYVTSKAPQKIDFRVTDAILNGTGVGQPLGILNSPGTIVIAKETGQATATVVYNNISKMWAAILPEARRNAIWMIHPDLEQQLMTLAFPGTGTTIPAYQPAAGIAAAPFGTLLGRPIFPTQAAQPLGSQGDIVFGDPGNYVTATKVGGVRADASIHLYFDYDVTAFRFVLRIGGQPWWNSSVLPFQTGATSRGFFSTLAARP